MSIVDGQSVNATNSNAAWISKNSDDTATGKLTLNNADVASGTQVTNVQRNVNSLFSFLGAAINGVYNLLPTWATSNRGTSSDSVFVRVEAIDTAFNSSTGHLHSGAAGDAPAIPFSNLSGTIGSGQISNGFIANSKLANMAAHTYKGNNTGSSAAPLDVTSTQLTADLNLFTSSLQGMVPASGGSSTSVFLNQAGTFTAPSTGVPAYNPLTKTANYTLVAGDVVAADASAGSFTLTLPDATTNAGKPILIVRKDATPSTVLTIAVAGSDTFNGDGTSTILNDQNDAVQLISIGAIWYVF